MKLHIIKYKELMISGFGADLDSAIKDGIKKIIKRNGKIIIDGNKFETLKEAYNFLKKVGFEVIKQ